MTAKLNFIRLLIAAQRTVSNKMSIDFEQRLVCLLKTSDILKKYQSLLMTATQKIPYEY